MKRKHALAITALPLPLYEKLREQAEAKGVTKSRLLRICVAEMLQGSVETSKWEGLKDLDEALEGLEELISGIVDARESPYLQELHVDAHAHVPIDSTAARLTLKLVEKLQNLIRKEEVNACRN